MMSVRTQLKSAAASDMGRRRTNNEDRYLHDAEHGIYAVVDGVGGHAAGEHAAETAVEVLRERLTRQTGTPEERLREAIALANNEILRLGQANPDWAGMACVLTVAVVEDDIVTVGHVGDSRLYLARPGEIRKVTQDHSPVGEREDRGEINEMAAMRHPRRNEIYRDLGSRERSPDEPGFIDIERFPLPVDGALLLCSDGLSDLVTSQEILTTLERSAQDPEAAVLALIDAANLAGGKDNITVLVVASPGFRPKIAGAPVASASPLVGKSLIRASIFPVLGLLFGAAAGAGGMYWFFQGSPEGQKTLTVVSAIGPVLLQAHSGDTVLIPAGRYRERLEMKAGVTIRALEAGTVTLTSPDGGPVIVARGIVNGTVEGVWIQGSLESPVNPAVLVDSGSPALTQVRITGAGTGIEIRGDAAPSIRDSRITNNLGPGIDVGATSRPVISGNLIAANGAGTPGSLRPGVEVRDQGQPVLKDNGIIDNAAEAIWIHSRTYHAPSYEENFFGGLSPKKAIRLLELPQSAPAEKKTRSGRQG